MLLSLPVAVLIKDIIKELKEYGVEILGYDPLLNNIEEEFTIKVIADLGQAKDVDCLIVSVVHDDFKKLTLARLKDVTSSNPILIDVRGFFSENEAVERGFYYRTL